MVVLIDSSQIAYRALYTVGDLSYRAESTGVIYGFLNQVLKIADKFETSDFVFVWDDKKSLRKEIYPDYKKGRHNNKSEWEMKQLQQGFAQIDRLREEIIPGLGFQASYRAEGYEADDVFASIVMNNKFSDCVIVSTDNDLWQLLSYITMQVHKYRDPVKYGKDIVTWSSFKEEWGISSKDWWKIKAFAGCSTDNVKGLKGYGYKKACKLLSQDPDKFDEIWKENEKMMELNTRLVKLPFEGTPLFKSVKEDLRARESGLDFFLDLCARYDFASFNKKEILNKWKTILSVEGKV